MVDEEVSVKKPFNYKKLILWVLIISIVIIIGLIIFLLGNMYSDVKSSSTQQQTTDSSTSQAISNNPAKKAVTENTSKEEQIQEAALEFDKSYIDYMLEAIGCKELHNPLFLSNTPKIKSLVDNDEYWSEVVDGKINTYEGSIDNPDLIIITTKQEAAKAMLSDDLTAYVKKAVWDGTITVEMVAGKIELASKGYLKLYDALYS